MAVPLREEAARKTTSPGKWAQKALKAASTDFCQKGAFSTIEGSRKAGISLGPLLCPRKARLRGDAGFERETLDIGRQSADFGVCLGFSGANHPMVAIDDGRFCSRLFAHRVDLFLHCF